MVLQQNYRAVTSMPGMDVRRAAVTEGDDAPLSVCHVASGDRWAGAEAQIATLLRALQKDHALRVSAILLNEGRLADELRAVKIAVKVIPEREHGFFATLRMADEFVRAQNVSVLHSHRYKENLLVALLARRCGVPVQVRTVHGMSEPFHGWAGVRQNLLHAIDRWSGRMATDAVIAVSKGMAPHLAAIYGECKVATICNGIETARVRSTYTRTEARGRLGLRDDPVIGIVGRLVPVKRIDLFLRMAEVIVPQVPSVQFVIAGDGPERAMRVEQARAAGLESKVHFLGHRDDVYDVLRAMDVMVMCSDHEGMPMTLLEALWLGVPVVGRRVPGIGEILRNEWNGLCLEGDDPQTLAAACLRLLHNPAFGQAMCHNAAQEIERGFTSGRNAELMAQLYLRQAGERSWQ